MDKTEDIRRLMDLVEEAARLERLIQLGGTDEATEYWTKHRDYYLRQAERQVKSLNHAISQEQVI